MSRIAFVAVLASAAALSLGRAAAAGSDVRLTNDCHPDGGCGAGYVSVYTLATGNPYTDQTLAECTISKGRQNEPAFAVNPRNTRVLLASSNDYCGVYNRGALAGAVGPIWLGYYRSLDGGLNWTSSLLPGRQLAVRGTVEGANVKCGRPGDRLGQSRPRVFWLRELGRSGRHQEDVRRPLRCAFPQPRWRRRSRHQQGRSRVLRDDSRSNWLVSAEFARQIQRQDGYRGRSYRRLLPRVCLLLVA